MHLGPLSFVLLAALVAWAPAATPPGRPRRAAGVALCGLGALVLTGLAWRVAVRATAVADGARARILDVQRTDHDVRPWVRYAVVGGACDGVVVVEQVGRSYLVERGCRSDTACVGEHIPVWANASCSEVFVDPLDGCLAEAVSAVLSGLVLLLGGISCLWYSRERGASRARPTRIDANR